MAITCVKVSLLHCLENTVSIKVCHCISLPHHVWEIQFSVLFLLMFLIYNTYSSHSIAQRHQPCTRLHPSEISAEENHCSERSLPSCRGLQLVTLCPPLQSGHNIEHPIHLAMGEAALTEFWKCVFLYIECLRNDGTVN